MSDWQATLHRSPPGEISADGCWVIFHHRWMYIGDSVSEALWQMVHEWQHDKHLAV